MNKLLLCLLLLPFQAWASVTYLWHNLTPFPSSGYVDFVEFRGSLTFDDATVASGHVTSDVPSDFTIGKWYSYLGMEQVYLAGAVSGGRIESCSQWNIDNPQDDPPYGPGLLRCDVLGEKVWGGFNGFIATALDFVGPYLHGSINGGGWEGGVVMESQDNLWRISQLASDNPTVTCNPFGCAGMLGYWQRVPEPVLGFELLALVLLFTLRRKL